jgi:hypothetical protein
MGPIYCPETSLRKYYSTLSNIPEERRSHLHRGGSWKSCIEQLRARNSLTCSDDDLGTGSPQIKEVFVSVTELTYLKQRSKHTQINFQVLIATANFVNS